MLIFNKIYELEILTDRQYLNFTEDNKVRAYKQFKNSIAHKTNNA